MTINNKVHPKGEDGLQKILCTMTKCIDRGDTSHCYDKDYHRCLQYKFLDNPLYKQGWQIGQPPLSD